MSLPLTLALRNLLHDRLRFVATLVGIVFSVVLVLIQMGLFFGFGHMVTTMIDHASADLWVVPKGAKCFEDPSMLDLKLRDHRRQQGRCRRNTAGDRLFGLAAGKR